MATGQEAFSTADPSGECLFLVRNHLWREVFLFMKTLLGGGERMDKYRRQELTQRAIEAARMDRDHGSVLWNVLHGPEYKQINSLRDQEERDYFDAVYRAEYERKR